jgi:hypothetical protein
VKNIREIFGKKNFREKTDQKINAFKKKEESWNHNRSEININFDPRIKLKRQIWKEKIHLEHEVHDQTLSTVEGEIINLEFSYSQFLNKFEKHSNFDLQLFKSLIVFLCRRIGSKSIVEGQLNLFKEVKVFIINDEQTFSPTRLLNNNKTGKHIKTIDKCLIYYLKFLTH